MIDPMSQPKTWPRYGATAQAFPTFNPTRNHHEKTSLGAAARCAMAWLNASASNSSYTAVAGASKLEFTGTQAGAEFNGTFHDYTASVELH